MRTTTLDYTDGDINLQGYIAYPDRENAPAVLIAPAWAGRDEFVCKKAREIAELGYIGFAIDMYGDARIGKSVEENSSLMSPFMENRTLLRQRITAAFTALLQQPGIDSNRIGAMGFCFGGLCALDLARSGADIKGVVSFHGLLQAPTGMPLETIKAKMLILHGYDDPMAKPNQLIEFADSMSAANVDWQIHAYSQTQHAFTNPQAHDDKLGLIYNARTAKRAWVSMQNFFAEVL
ncbi:MAG: dienelactone hydrolase family protein [Pseudomonadota bacterium]|nr:dienelactone hydrolase family protein [Pseudomonadota bacterium]